MKTPMTLILMTAVLAAPSALAGTPPAAADPEHAIRDQGRRALAAIGDELRDSLRPTRPELALRHAVHGTRVALTPDESATAPMGI